MIISFISAPVQYLCIFKKKNTLIKKTIINNENNENNSDPKTPKEKSTHKHTHLYWTHNSSEATSPWPYLRGTFSPGPSVWLSSPSPCMSGTAATRSFRKSNCCSNSMHCFLWTRGGIHLWRWMHNLVHLPMNSMT